MANITDLLKNILSAVYGRDVRQSIHDAIQQCYTDAINPGYYTPSVDSRGNLTWSGNKDYMPSLPSSIITGPKPVKGVDYWTEADKNDILDTLIEMMRFGPGGRVYINEYDDQWMGSVMSGFFGNAAARVDLVKWDGTSESLNDSDLIESGTSGEYGELYYFEIPPGHKLSITVGYESTLWVHYPDYSSADGGETIQHDANQQFYLTGDKNERISWHIL